jgi:hypothetical protein
MNSTESVTPKNIQVGKFYLNKEVAGIVYVCTAQRYTKQKTLVCIRGNKNNTIKPFFTVFPPSKCPGVWFNFYLAPDQELIKNEIFK